MKHNTMTENSPIFQNLICEFDSIDKKNAFKSFYKRKQTVAYNGSKNIDSREEQRDMIEASTHTLYVLDEF